VWHGGAWGSQGGYVFDRGYADYDLVQDLQALPCSCIGRGKSPTADALQAERSIAAAAQTAGGQQDAVLRRLGTAPHCRLVPQPCRIVRVATGKTDAQGTPEVIGLGRNRCDLEADLVALAYRYRWAVELFFRWVQCVVGGRHRLSPTANGVRMHV
jgi:Transposase DDE domain